VRPRSLSRRAVLAGGAVSALSGCSGTPGTPQPSPAPSASDDPEKALLRKLIADKERVIALYSTLIAAGQTKLGPFRDRHQAHLDELRKRLGETAKPSPTASAAPRTSLSRLRDTERKSAALRARQVAGVSPQLAQLVASIGACEAAHALALPRSS
jgi:hypothetical protein